MDRYDLDLDDTEFKLIRERSRKRRRPKKVQHTISKRERAALKKWEMEIIKEYEKANEKTKRKKSCKKQPLIKTLYAIKKPKTSRKKRRSTKAVQNPEEQKESVEPVVAAKSSPTSTEPTEPTVSPPEPTEPTVSPPESTEETVAKPAEEQPSENKTVLSSMAESLGISSSNQEQTEKPPTTEAKTGGKRKRKGCKKGGK
jgi:hypothetical protein